MLQLLSNAIIPVENWNKKHLSKGAVCNLGLTDFFATCLQYPDLASQQGDIPLLHPPPPLLLPCHSLLPEPLLPPHKVRPAHTLSLALLWEGTRGVDSVGYTGTAMRGDQGSGLSGIHWCCYGRGTDEWTLWDTLALLWEGTRGVDSVGYTGTAMRGDQRSGLIGIHWHCYERGPGEWTQWDTLALLWEGTWGVDTVGMALREDWWSWLAGVGTWSREGRTVRNQLFTQENMIHFTHYLSVRFCLYHFSCALRQKTFHVDSHCLDVSLPDI